MEWIALATIFLFSVLCGRPAAAAATRRSLAATFGAHCTPTTEDDE